MTLLVGEDFELDVSPDEGFLLSFEAELAEPDDVKTVGSRRVRGFHVRYRRVGGRRWTSFFLECDRWPELELVERVAREHEASRASAA